MQNENKDLNELELKYKKQMQIIDNIQSDKSKNSNYDYYKIKNIIKSNLEEKNINNKYKEYLQDDEKVEENRHKEELVDKTKKPGIEEINQMELQVLEKTKEIEEQIKEINKKRLEFVINEFKNKLIELSKKDEEAFEENLNKEFKLTLNQLEEQKNIRLNSIKNLQEKVNETILFCKRINEDLKSKKIEINSDFDCYVDFLGHEKNEAIKKYENDMVKYIEKRVNVFKTHLEKQFN
jgi:hypothetical protein